MKKKSIISAISILGILLISYFGILQYFRQPSSSQKGGHSYFTIIPIAKWTDAQFPTPCLSIQIGNKTISSELDLGFRGQFSLSVDVLNQIEEKKYLKSKKMYGYGGKEYEKKVYEIPEIRIGPLLAYQTVVQEEAKDFHANGTLTKNGDNLSEAEPGRIGWEIFQLSNLLLDLGNKTVAFSDSLSTLKKSGYAVESFTKTPLITDRGLIEIDAITSHGQLRCVLDTGCTFNILNTENKIVYDPQKTDKISSFEITEKEFGPLNFHRLPIELPIHIDAFLGMEFFTDNLVFLDFTNNLAYFAPSVKSSSSSPKEYTSSNLKL